MSPLGFLLIAIIIALPIAWLASEFRENRTLRITLGVLAIGVTATCIWALSSVLTRFNYNAWYGGATGDLIKTSLHQIDDGHLDRVLKVWRGLGQRCQPTYETGAGYQELVKEAADRMRGGCADPGRICLGCFRVQVRDLGGALGGRLRILDCHQ